MTDHSAESLSRTTRPDTESVPAAPESVDALFDTLLGELDAPDIAELAEARLAVLWALSEEPAHPKRREAVWEEYARIGEEIVDRLDPSAGNARRARVQITLALHKALILREAQRTGRYIEELDTAETQAHNMRFDSLASAIHSEIETLGNDLESSPEILLYKVKHKISELNREFLRDQLAAGDDYEDILTGIYNALLEEGEDPEEVLADLNILRR